jgi:hypothetical protein
MTTWTSAAKDELDHYFGRTRDALAASGADAEEVIDDLRRHVEAEVAAARLKVVTESDVRQLLARIGPPAPLAANDAKPAARGSPLPGSPPAWPTIKPSVWLLIFGVILPVITLGIEVLTGMCAGAFFDPIPSVWHVLLVALVPLVNGLTLLALRDDRREYFVRLSWANGLACAVALFYAILFVPLLLPGAFAVIFFGWGLLPWTPMLALVATVLLRRGLGDASARAGVTRLPGFWRGFGIALSAVLLVEAPVWLTRHGLQLATSDESAEERRGLRLLRAFGHEETLLRACYGRTRGAANMDVIGWVIEGGEGVGPEQAREVFYRVTGKPFNAVPAPKVRTGRGRWAGLDDWTWDLDQGGERVGGRVKGLSLHSSRLDATVEPEAALAYCEWTMEFRNDWSEQREARAQVQLPPGGVVSRLTLWVNGEPREAAFAGRAHVRQAYEQVAIRQRRDPVLVTTCGPDRVLVQCFPVPPNGGLMKVRLGVTAPLLLQKADEGVLLWPHFLERNFTLKEEFRHSVWLEAPAALATEGKVLTAAPGKNGGFAIRGQANDTELAAARNAVRVRRDGAARLSWAKDTRSQDSAFVRQSIVETAATPPPRVVFVIDGSLPMRDRMGEIAGALRKLPDGLPFTLLLASDRAQGLASLEFKSDAASRAAAANSLQTWRVEGGQDNVPALVRAVDLAARDAGGVVVWIHGPQPVLLTATDALRQRFEWQPDGIVLHELQTEAGPNRITEQLDRLPAVRSVPRFGDLAQDLERLFGAWDKSAKQFALVRERVTTPAAAADNAREASLHLVRLWARDEIRRLQSVRDLRQALALAARYQLVTPMSGAVVLETQAQYTATGLQPAEPTTVPMVPEPQTWALLLGGGLMLVVVAKRRRKVHAS